MAKKNEEVEVVAESVTPRVPSGVEIVEEFGAIVVRFASDDQVRNSTLNHLANILQQLQRFSESDAVRSAVVPVEQV